MSDDEAFCRAGVEGHAEMPYTPFAALYSGADLKQHVPAPVGVSGQGPERTRSAVNLGFGASTWLAFALLSTPSRRDVSAPDARRDRAALTCVLPEAKGAGMKSPCNASLTVQRLGDAVPWSPEPPRAGGAGVSANDEASASAGHHVVTERLTAKLVDPERNGHCSPSASYRSV